MAGRVTGRWRLAVGAPVAYGNIRSRYIVVFTSPPLHRPWRGSLTRVLHGTAITKTPRLLRIPIVPPVFGLPYIGLGSFRWSSPGARLTKSDLIIPPSAYGPQFSFSAKTLWRCTPTHTPYRGTATEAPSLASDCGFGGGGGGDVLRPSR